jgi:hypothetical protein
LPRLHEAVEIERGRCVGRRRLRRGVLRIDLGLLGQAGIGEQFVEHRQIEAQARLEVIERHLAGAQFDSRQRDRHEWDLPEGASLTSNQRNRIERDRLFFVRQRERGETAIADVDQSDRAGRPVEFAAQQTARR